MRIFIDHPVSTTMLFLALLLLGIYSLFHIPLELAPKEEYPRITVRTGWFGASPEAVQVNLTSPLEELCSTVKGVRKIESSSSIGTSEIIIEFSEKVDMEFASLELRERIATFVDKLPPGGSPPQVIPFIPKEFETKPFLSIVFSSDISINALRDIIQNKISERIRAIRGVSNITIIGGSEPEIRMVLDRERLHSYGLSLSTILRNLSQDNITYPAGKVKKDGKDFIFRVPASIEKIEDLKNTIVGFYGGIPLRLKDIGKLEIGYGENLSLRRINGESTVGMDIIKEPGIGTLKVAKTVKEELERIKKELPSNIIIRIVEDESGEIEKRLKNLLIMMGLIIVIIFILLYIFLGSFVPSLVILSSIFFSVCITLNLVYIFGITLNLLTLSGLALGFGMLVDNSVVVFENIWRRFERGNRNKEEMMKATKEVALPALGATLTTVAVFLAFPFFQGRLRIYYLPLAIVIMFSLLSSYLVAFTLIPSLSLKIIRAKRSERGWSGKSYKGLIHFFLKYPLLIIILIATLIYGSYRIFKKEVSFGVFFSWYYKESLTVWVNTPPGTPIERTNEIIKEFEDRVLSKDYPKEVNTYVSSERAYMRITFPKNVEQSPTPFILKEELINLATNFAGISIGVYGFDPQGYYSGFYGSFLPCRIKFLGYNYHKLKEITNNTEKTLLKHPRIKEVKTVSSRWFWGGQDYYEFTLNLDREKLGRYNVSIDEILPSILANIKGRAERNVLKLEGKEWKVSLKIKGSEDMELERLKDVLIRTSNGEYVRLGDVISVSDTPIAGSIDREDQQFQRTVMWDYMGPYKAAERYKNALFKNLVLPSGYSATMEELWKLTEEEERKLGIALILSLCFVFMILAALYEDFIHPFIVMISVPLALIGVFIAFVVADFSFDSSAYIGLILMGGIVANNAILMVNHINLKRREGMELMEAIKIGASERVRPILITTSTTILGMLPFVLIQTEKGRDIWSTLALSTLGGLTSSTIFILFATPIFYHLGEKLRGWLWKIGKEISGFSDFKEGVGR